MARVYETSVVLLLLTLLVLGMVWVASAIAGNGAVSRQSLYGGCWGCGMGGGTLGQHGAESAGRSPGALLCPDPPCSPQTSGNATCPTSTPASRSLACCSCCVSAGT